MSTWPDRRLIDLLGIDIPIVQAPMAGAGGAELAAAVCHAGALGSLPCAMLDVATARAEIGVIRQRTRNPLNLNFFCHQAPPDAAATARWRAATARWRAATARWRAGFASEYEELGLAIDTPIPNANREPFSDAMCALVEAHRPEVVSFHFGLPEATLLNRVKAAGCRVMSSATTVAEAIWLAERGVDAIIAQGYEAGGHRGLFLSAQANDHNDIATQPGTLALVPQVVDAVSLPVIAAGGIADGRGIAAAFALGAAGVQIGTAYLFTPESLISQLHRAALAAARDDATALTNVFTGRPARGIVNRVMREHGPMNDSAPPFPTAAGALAPLKAAAEAKGSSDFSALWAGQSAPLCATSRSAQKGAADLTAELARDALACLQRMAS